MKTIRCVLHVDWFTYYIRYFENQHLGLMGHYLHICTPNRGCYEEKVLERD